MRKFCRDCVHYSIIPGCMFPTHCEWGPISFSVKSNMDPKVHNARNDCEHFKERPPVKEPEPERGSWRKGFAIALAIVAWNIIFIFAVRYFI